VTSGIPAVPTFVKRSDGSDPEFFAAETAGLRWLAAAGPDAARVVAVVEVRPDRLVLARLRAAEPHSVVASAKTGEGIGEVLTAIEGDLPRPGVVFEALLPYDRGDLLNRIHTGGEVDHLEHTGDGTRVSGRVNADLAGELEPYLV